MIKFAYISSTSSLSSQLNSVPCFPSLARWFKFFLLISFGHLCLSVQSPNDDENSIDNTSYQEFIPWKGVQPSCECHHAGISNITNCNRPCLCKLNVEGELCDRCKFGYFDLFSEDPYGCRECFCFNQTKHCRGVRWRTVPVVESEGWLITTDLNSHSVQPQTENGFPSIASDDAPDGMYFWLAPPKYLGCKLDALDSVMIISFEAEKSRGDSSGITLAHDFDIIMQGGPKNLKIGYKWKNLQWKSQRMKINYKVHLRNDGWFIVNPIINQTSGNFSSRSTVYLQASKAEMASVLGDLKVLMIRAKFHTAQISCILKKVDMMIADWPSDTSDPSSVVREECVYPKNFKPPSCRTEPEPCPPGHWRAKDYQYGTGSSCVKCQCNNHSVSCDIRSGECDCQHNTWGPHCGECKPGFYGFATRGTENDCRPCDCPTVDDYFDYTPCHTAPDGDFICERCPPHLMGPKCDVCVNGALPPQCLEDPPTTPPISTTTTMSTTITTTMAPTFTIPTTTLSPLCDEDPCIVKLKEDVNSLIYLKDPFDLRFIIEKCDKIMTRLINLEQLISEYRKEDTNILEYFRQRIEKAKSIESRWPIYCNVSDALEYSRRIESLRNESDFIVNQLKFIQHKSIGEQEIRESEQKVAAIRRIGSEIDLAKHRISNEKRIISNFIDQLRSLTSKLLFLRSLVKRLAHLQYSIEDAEIKADESIYQAIVAKNLTSNLYNQKEVIIQNIARCEGERKNLDILKNQTSMGHSFVRNILAIIGETSSNAHQLLLRLPDYYQLLFDALNSQFKDSNKLKQKVHECEQHVQRYSQKVSQADRIFNDKTHALKYLLEKPEPYKSILEILSRVASTQQDIENKVRDAEKYLDSIRNIMNIDISLIDKQIIELMRNLPSIQEMVTHRVKKLEHKFHKVRVKTDNFRKAFNKINMRMHVYMKNSNITRQRGTQIMDFTNRIKDGCVKVESKVERIKSKSNSFRTQIEAHRQNSTWIPQSLQSCFKSLEKSQMKVSQAEKTVQIVSEKTEKFYQKVMRIQSGLNSIRRKIARARQKASEFRFSLKSDGSNFCSRSFMVSKSSSYNNSISLTYSPPNETIAIKNSSLFYIAGNKTGDYLALDIVDQQVRFSWNLGGGPGIIQHPHKLLPSIVPSKTEEKWYRIDVQREGPKAILSVGQVGNASSFLQVSSSSPGNSFELTLSPQDQVFIGGFPFGHKVTHSNGSYFAGCITDVYFDDEIINLWNFRNNTGCQGCFEGPEDSMNSFYFDGKSSFSEQNTPSFRGEDSNVLTFSIRTFQAYSLLSLCNNHKNGDFISISMDQGKVYLHLRFGRNPRHSVCTRRKLNDGQRVEISAEMFERKVVLKINGQEEGSIDTEIATSGLNICSTVYFGGVPLDTHSGQWPELPAVSFKGCMSDVQIDTTTLDLLNGRFYGVAAGCRGFDQKFMASETYQKAQNPSEYNVTASYLIDDGYNF